MKYLRLFQTHAEHKQELEELEKLGRYTSYCEDNKEVTIYNPYTLKKMGVGDYLLKNGSVVKSLDAVSNMTDVIAVRVIPEYFLPDGKARYVAIRAGHRKTVTNNVVTYPSAAIDQKFQWCNSQVLVNTLGQFNEVPCADTDTVNIDKHKILNNYTAQGWHIWGCTCMEISTKYESLNPRTWQKYKNNDVTDSSNPTNTNNVFGTTTYNNLNDWYMQVTNASVDDSGNNENTHNTNDEPPAAIPSPYIGTNGVYVFNGAYRTNTDVFGRTGSNMLTDIDGKANTALLLADITESRKHDAALFCSEYTVKDSDTDEFADWYAPGQWYLPALGELVFVLSGWATIQEAIYDYNQKSGLGTTFHTVDGYWSSTQCEPNYACAIYTYIGQVDAIKQTSTAHHVRPFLRLY